MTGWEIAFAVAVFLLAGSVKGTLGIGLPTIAISLMSQVLDPRLAVTLTIGPLLLTNLQQAVRSGFFLRTLRRYAPYWATLAVIITFSAIFAQGLSAAALLMVMGGSVVFFTALQLFVRPPRLPARFDRLAQIAAGATSGLMGGVTAIWGPPILMYLISSRVEKDEFVRATGVLLTLGAIPLAATYAAQGHLAGDRAAVSFALAIPSVLGFMLGERLRRYLKPERFHTAVLVMFLLLGLNLLRRGMTGG